MVNSKLFGNSNAEKLLIAVFIIASALRVLLALTNYQANDNHIPVIEYLKKHGAAPEGEECYQCYQPKLYHSAVAAILYAFSIDEINTTKKVSQLINCIAGIITISLVFSFLNSINISKKTRLVSFSMIALNPKLIGINAQATNDSFVILFSTGAIYFGYRFFQNLEIKHFIYMTISTVLAALSKGNGIVIFIGILIVFFLKMFQSRSVNPSYRRNYFIFLLLLISAYLITVPQLGDYWHKYQKYGAPFSINEPIRPFPNLIKNTYVGRPGVTSILNSYFTFRFIDLIKNPTTQILDVYTPHRTSLWSQLYGRFHFIFFDGWPPAWNTKNKITLNIGRMILILGLVPTFILILGILKRSVFWIKSIIKKDTEFILKTNEWIFDIMIFGYISFIVIYTSLYRDFGTMKVIFIFPALLPAAVVFSRELDSIYKTLRNKTKLINSIDLSFVLLFSLYLITVVILICKLWRSQP